MALIAAPVIAIAVHRAGVTPPAAHGRLLAAEAERAWRQATPQPLRFVGCDVADEVIAYAQDRPHSLPLRFFRGDIARQGVRRCTRLAAACGLAGQRRARQGLPKAAWCWSVWPTKLIGSTPLPTQAARDPASRRIDVKIARDFLGIPGKPQHYVIFIVPPQQ